MAKATHYQVTLDRYNIKTELVPTHHAVLYRFTFPESAEASIAIDVVHSLVIDIATNVGGTVNACFVKFDETNPRKIYGGGRYSGGFGDGEYPLFFSAELSEEPEVFGTWLNQTISSGSLESTQANPDDRTGAYVQYKTEEGQEIYLKMAISFKSAEKAKEFMSPEIEDWNFEKLQSRGEQAWNRELHKIQIEGATEDQKKIFYTSLYHSFLQPRDRSLDNRFWEGNTPFWDDQFAVWDTWRTAFPLLSLLKPEIVSSNVQSFIDRYDHNGIVHDAFIAGIDMYAEQGGNNIDNVIADAIMKDLKGFDYEEAYQVLKYNADNERLGWQGFDEPEEIKETYYKERGWIPGDIMSCSYTLEYAYNDFCIAQVAKKLGYSEDHDFYMKRSKQWENLWNAELVSDGFKGFIAPKDVEGNWINIDPKKDWHSWHEYFYEANSWTYSFFVPQDFKRLIELSGGNERYCERLEHSIMNGLLNISNEPSFAAVRSFSYAGSPDLTSKWVRYIMSGFYDLEGYPGNDDSGAMSSWYVFSALGFFPNAGQKVYILNSPLFKKATITLDNGNQIIIKAPNASDKNIYIKSCKLNGKELDHLFLDHQDLVNGAVLEFDLVE